GVACEVYTVEDAPHGVGPWEKNPAWQTYKIKMVDWLRQTLR
ncbi:MAG: alpha/beta hydrolase, partial [Acidobacteriia bacterium]|nr:alpha/beta hydrolase [Terriglobia bacterium]